MSSGKRFAGRGPVVHQMTGSVLFIAADPREFAGLLPQWEKVAPLQLPVHWARIGRWKGREVIAIANGAGAPRAFAAVLLAPKPSAVCSIGFCGALDESLRIGDVVVGTEIRDGESTWPTAIPDPPPATAVVVASIDHIARTAAEKRNLRATGASIVEMEAAGAARASEDLDLPFYCIRAVSDLADEDLANDYNAALKPDGRFSLIRLIKQGHINELIRLQRRTSEAASKLGAFLAKASL
jgi:adenosylhomocysteine nucleosidase